MNVIPFDRARARVRIGAPPRIEPPAALTSAVRAADIAHSADADGEDRLRMRQNLAAFLVIVAIVTAGIWLMASLEYYSRLQSCMIAGHRNCMPLQAKYLSQPYWR
jgi:hypothetical protein